MALDETRRHQQVAVDFFQDVGAHHPAVGNAVLDVERQIPVLEQEDLETVLREVDAQPAITGLETGQRHPGGTKSGDRDHEVPAFGQGQANQGRPPGGGSPPVDRG